MPKTSKSISLIKMVKSAVQQSTSSPTSSSSSPTISDTITNNSNHKSKPLRPTLSSMNMNQLNIDDDEKDEQRQPYQHQEQLEQEQRQHNNTRRSRTTISSSLSSSSSSSSFVSSSQKQNRILKECIIQSMLKQESTTYKCNDYLNSSQKQTVLIHPRKEVNQDGNNNQHDEFHHFHDTENPLPSNPHLSPRSMSSMVSRTTTRTSSSKDTLSTKKRRLADLSCRDKICEWIYRIINFFNIDRESAYYTLSYIDRFLMQYRVDRFTYKLLATTCLLLALKVHQPRKLILKNVVKDLSKGDFDIEDVNRMELIVLRTLLWSLNPPTPLHFMRRLIDLHEDLFVAFGNSLATDVMLGSSSQTTSVDVEVLQSYSTFFVELSLFDYYFVTKRQSRIAIAAILNSIEGLEQSNICVTSFSKNQSKAFLYKIVMSCYDLVDFNFNDAESQDEMTQMREKLWDLYENSEESANVKSGSFGRRANVGNTGLKSHKIGFSSRFVKVTDTQHNNNSNKD